MKIVGAVLDVAAALARRPPQSTAAISATGLVKAFGGVVLKLEVGDATDSESSSEDFVWLAQRLSACVGAATIASSSADAADPALLGLLLSLSSTMATKSLKQVASLNTSECVDTSEGTDVPLLSTPGALLTAGVCLLSRALLLTYLAPSQAGTGAMQTKLALMLDAYLAPSLRMLLQCPRRTVSSADRRSPSWHLDRVVEALPPLLALGVSSSLPALNKLNMPVLKSLLNGFLLGSSARVSAEQLDRHQAEVEALLCTGPASSPPLPSVEGDLHWWALQRCYCVKSCMAFLPSSSGTACEKIAGALARYEQELCSALDAGFPGGARGSKGTQKRADCSATLLCSKYNMLRHLVAARYYRLNVAFQSGSFSSLDISTTTGATDQESADSGAGCGIGSSEEEELVALRVLVTESIAILEELVSREKDCTDALDMLELVLCDGALTAELPTTGGTGGLHDWMALLGELGEEKLQAQWLRAAGALVAQMHQCAPGVQDWAVSAIMELQETLVLRCTGSGLCEVTHAACADAKSLIAGFEAAPFSAPVNASATRLREVLAVTAAGEALLDDKLTTEADIGALLETEAIWADSDVVVVSTAAAKVLTDFKTARASAGRNALDAFEKRALQVLEKMRAGSSHWCKFTQCCLLLLLSKSLLFVGGAHAASLQWCKHALGVLTSLPVGRGVPSHWTGYFAILRAEFLLLSALIFEQAGDLSHSMAYLVEAAALGLPSAPPPSSNDTSATDTHSGGRLLSLGNAVSVQLLIHAYSARTWHRMHNSSRLERSLTKLSAVAASPAAASRATIVGELVQWLKWLTTEDHSRSGIAACRLFHLCHSWDVISRQVNSLNAGGKVTAPSAVLPLTQFDTCMDIATKLDTLIEHLRGAAVAERDATRMLVLHSTHAPAPVPTGANGSSETTRYPGSCTAFDINRFLRRRSATSCIHEAKVGGGLGLERATQALRCFVLAASSSFCSLEFCGSSRFPHAETVEGVAGLLAAATALPERSSTTAALQEISAALQGLGSESTSSGGTALCAMILDDTAKRLVVSRVCGSVPVEGGAESQQRVHCVSLPVTEAFRQQLSQWELLMAENQRQLGETRDLEVISKWTEKDKKAWWGRRFDTDDAIKSHLCTLQEYLGVWTCLFEGHADVPALECGHADQWLTRLSTAEVARLHEGLFGKRAASETAARTRLLGLFEHLLPWMQLLMPCGGTEDAQQKQDLFSLSTRDEQVASAVADIVSQYVLSTCPGATTFSDELAQLLATTFRRCDGDSAGGGDGDAQEGELGPRRVLAFHLGDDPDADADDPKMDALIGAQSPGSGHGSPVDPNPVGRPVEEEQDQEQRFGPAATSVPDADDEGVGLGVPALCLCFEEMKVAELKEHCKTHGIPTNGKKSDLIDRLKEHRATAAVAAAAPTQTTKPATGGPFYVAPAAAPAPVSRPKATPATKPSRPQSQQQAPTPFTPMRGATPGHLPLRTPHTAKLAPARGLGLSCAKPSFKTPSKTPRKTPAGITIFQEDDDELADEVGLLCITPATGAAKKVGALAKKTPASALTTDGRRKKSGSSSSSGAALAPRTASRGHVLFVFDEFLQPLPLESMPVLQRQHRPCSRMPGLASVLISARLRVKAATARASPDCVAAASQQEPVGKVTKTSKSNTKSATGKPLSGSSVVKGAVSAAAASLDLQLNLDLQHSWYVVDPEHNLSGTRATMGALLQPFASSYGWPGFVGEAPSEAEVRRQHEAAELFIFCGHGHGNCLMRDWAAALRRLQSCPAALLWGCSSGALPRHGVHDPTGVVCAYLAGGAPFVVGNLWDVTERDIDTLSAHYMSGLLSDQNKELSSGTEEVSSDRRVSSTLLSTARNTCKLKYAVGAAAVMYGLPVKIK